ncbi:MAG: transporter [Bacteroidetes bacterium]|nr:transporter [Bacteroidota bacterium]
MKRRFLILIGSGILLCPGVTAQKILTLKECYDRAASVSALASEKNAYSEIWKLKDKNLSGSWLPALDANGTILYNSSVVDLSDMLGSLPIPGIADMIKPLPHDQYKLTVDLNQMIYDGGAIKSARSLEKVDLSINEKQTETDLYKLRDQINGFFFNLLLLDRQKDLLSNYQELLNKRIVSLQSALSSGVILKTDVDVMTSERIKLEQQITENKIRKESLIKLLAGLTGTEIDPATELVLPLMEGEPTAEISRPELQLFDLRKEQITASLRMIESKRLPKAFGFATLGYGNPPGNNFFKDEFAPYYVVGAAIKWNIFDWNKAKNEKQILSLQKNIIETRENDLTDNLNRLLEAKKAEILTLQSLIKSDEELILIRKRISASAGSQYENGTITATDYLNELNSEQQALINFEIHKINLAMAKVEYYNISGKEIE